MGPEGKVNVLVNVGLKYRPVPGLASLLRIGIGSFPFILYYLVLEPVLSVFWKCSLTCW